MQEQFTNETSPLQEPQVIQNEAPSRPHIWWWVGGGLLLVLVVSASLYGYWRVASTASTSEITIEPELSTVCCSSLPGEYKRDNEHVYILYPWAELSRSELESKMGAELSSTIGVPYERDEVLILLDGFDPNSFRIEGSYLVDNSGVYDQPLDVFGEILNGKMRYVGERDGIAVLQNERYKKSQVFVARTVERDLLNGQIEPLDYASTLERDVNGSVYQNGELTKIPDPESFVAIPVPNDSWIGYYKDKDHVYKVEGQEQILNVLEGVDKDSFEILESVTIPCQGNCEDAFPEAVYSYLKDKNNVYFENVMSGVIRIIRGADPATFEVLDGKVYYDAQDKNHKYLKGETVAFNSQNLDVLTGKDGKDWGFARDKDRVYYNNRDFVDESNQEYFIIASKYPEEVVSSWKEFNLDVDSFSVVGDGYIKDKNKVLFLGALQIALVKMADAATFTIDDETVSPDSYGGAVAKDAMNVYRAHRVIEGADPKTFERIDGNWAKDIDSVFAEANDGVAGMYEVSGIDPSSFAPLSFGSESTVYGIAQNKIVCAHVGYIEADITSFEVTSEFSARDKDREYWGCNVYDPENP